MTEKEASALDTAAIDSQWGMTLSDADGNGVRWLEFVLDSSRPAFEGQLGFITQDEGLAIEVVDEDIQVSLSLGPAIL